MQPAQELQSLRYNPVTAGDVALAAGDEAPLTTIQGNSIEIAVTLRLDAGGVCGIRVCRSPDNRERTSIFYDDAAGTLNLDTCESSLGEGPKTIESAPFRLASGEALALRVFIDKSVIEVYANDRQAIVRRIYPTLPASVGVSLFAQGGAAKATEITAWEMMPSNPY